MKKSKVLFLSVILITLMCGCRAKDEDSILNHDTYMIVAINDLHEGNIEVHKDINSDTLYEVRESIIVNEFNSNKYNEADEVLKLDVITEGKDLDISRRVSEYVYDITLSESSKYIEYLKTTGYSIVRECCTPDYIDIILTNNSDTKRILIGKETLVVTPINEIDSLNLLNYLKR